jgi:hypothetical protein
MLTKLSAKVNPSLLKTLQRVYLIKTGVINNRTGLQEQNIDAVFEQINTNKDGRGNAVLNKFDELFDLHKDYPKQQYELLNTAYTDSVYITCILETNILIGELKQMIKTLEDKAKEMEDKVRYARNNGKIIDMKVSSLFTNWKNYLVPYIEYLENDIQKLQKIPLGSKLDTNDENFKCKKY